MPRPARREPYRVFFRKRDRRWVVEFGHGKDRGQKYVPREIKGEVAANRWASENFGGAVPVARDTSSFGVLYDRFVAARWVEAKRKEPRFSPSTVANNESHGGKIKEALGELDPEHVGPPELRKFIRDLRDGGVEPQTVRNYYYSLVAFFDDAMAEGWVKHESNPARHPGVLKEVPDPTSRRGGQKVITLPIEHCQDLINGMRVPLAAPVIPLRRRASYAVECTLGTRPGEGPGLLVGDVDLEKAEIKVERQLGLYTPQKKGKGLRQPKRNSKRRLPLHPAARAALAEWLAEWEVFVGRKPKPTDPLFPSSAGKATRNRQAERLRRDLLELGLPSESKGQRVTAQALRRSVSSWLKKLGVDKSDRKRLLGHADADVTDQHYTDDDITPLRRAVALLPFTWPSPVEGMTSPDGTGNAGRNAGSPSSYSLPPQESPEVRIGFEPTYNGFANRTDEGSLAVTAANSDQESQTDPDHSISLSGQSYSLAPSETTPAPDGYAGTEDDDPLALLPRKVPPPDVQDFVAEQLAEAFPHAFDGGDLDQVLRPLARAAEAIEAGEVPSAAGGKGGR